MSIKFEFEKETKGTVRYREISEDPVIGTLYIKKSKLKELGLTGKEVIEISISKEEK